MKLNVNVNVGIVGAFVYIECFFLVYFGDGQTHSHLENKKYIDIHTIYIKRSRTYIARRICVLNCLFDIDIELFLLDLN